MKTYEEAAEAWINGELTVDEMRSFSYEKIDRITQDINERWGSEHADDFHFDIMNKIG